VLTVRQPVWGRVSYCCYLSVLAAAYACGSCFPTSILNPAILQSLLIIESVFWDESHKLESRDKLSKQRELIDVIQKKKEDGT
jgi:hypothetical protein